MIEERFVQAAIRIRREFLKISTNMNLYHKQAGDLVKTLNNLQKEISEKQELIDSGQVNYQESVKIAADLIKQLEDETKRISDDIDPLNNGMESLLQEETELWRQIKEKHSNIDENNIIDYVKQRIIEAGLSK
jgi:polyhydroxyalkanoate synthesis regulator phasin